MKTRRRMKDSYMDTIIPWLLIMAPCSALLTGIGIFAWRRKQPMWFWSGSTVKEEEISDVRAYNRANGIMWIAFSLIFWICTAIGIWNTKAAGIMMMAGCAAGIPLLIVAYRKIYRKYAKGEKRKAGGGRPA